MEIFMNTIIQYVSEIVAILVISAIGVFGSWLLNKMKQQKGLENIAMATEQVIQAAQVTVRELQQTLVGNWKEQQENGKLTAEQIVELKQKAIEITLKKLSEPTLKLLESAKIDVEVMITSAAEAYIYELKSKEDEG